MKIVFDNNKFISANRSLVKYRIHSNSLSKKTINIQMKEIMSILDQFKNNTFLYRKYKKSFDICIYKFDHLLKAKKLIELESFFSTSKEFYLLSKVSKKYLLFSILLMIPVLNKFFYDKFLYKYIY